MNYYQNLRGFLPILLSIIIFSFGCSRNASEKDHSALREEFLQANASPPSASPVSEELPEEKQPYVAVERPTTQIGILKEKANFWIGYPHEAGSMVYLKLAANTEIKILDLVEEYYKVAHRSMIGFVEKSIVDIGEAGNAESTEEAQKPNIPSTSPTETPEPEPLTKNEENLFSSTVTPCTGALNEELFPGVSCVQYRSKVQEKVSTLENYIKRIIDKSEMNRQKSIDLACRLFVNEQARVYTSSLNEAGRSRPIRKYLNSLMVLNYDRVEIEWTNIQYVSELRKGPDGRYFGFVHIEQKFEGFMDDRLVYGDITEKKITVILEAYEVVDAGGETTTRWDVFLSDIGVEQTQNIQ